MGTAEETGYALEARLDGEELVFSLSGRVSLGDADRLLAEMESHLDDPMAGAVTVDLAGISYMDSAGVLTLFRLEERIRQKGRAPTYVHVPPEVQKVMDLIDRREFASHHSAGKRRLKVLSRRWVMPATGSPRISPP